MNINKVDRPYTIKAVVNLAKIIDYNFLLIVSLYLTQSISDRFKFLSRQKFGHLKKGFRRKTLAGNQKAGLGSSNQSGTESI